LDTNIFLVTIPPKSLYHAVFQGIIQKDYTLVVSQDILLEYEEILAQRANPNIAKNALSLLQTLPNVENVNINFQWEIIQVDKDDNKFVDTAFNGNADYLVTNDKHFEIVKINEFPSVKVVNLNEFLEIIQKK
jgi:uncharacterized protein